MDPTIAGSRPGHGERPRFAPLYVQIKQFLTQDLQDGRWPPGAAIPSEIELAAHYGVSQGTVRKAVAELAAENLLVRRQGRGTFVASHDEPRAQFRFLRLLPDDGAEEPLSSRIVGFRRMRAPAEVCRALGLQAGDPVMSIRRVLELRARPVVLDDIWLPARRFRGLTAQRLAACDSPLYSLFEREFGTRMVRASERLKAVAADSSAARLLDVAPGSPLLQAERISLTYDEVAVEFRRGLYLTTAHHYFSELG